MISFNNITAFEALNYLNHSLLDFRDRCIAEGEDADMLLIPLRQVHNQFIDYRNHHRMDDPNWIPRLKDIKSIALKCIVEMVIDQKVKKQETLVWAVKYGHSDSLQDNPAANPFSIVKLLQADEGIKPNFENGYIVRIAAMNGYADMVSLLLTDSKVNPTDHEDLLARYDTHDCIHNLKELLDNRAINQSKEIYPMLSSQWSHAVAIKILTNLFDHQLAPFEPPPSQQHLSGIEKSSWVLEEKEKNLVLGLGIRQHPL